MALITIIIHDSQPGEASVHVASEPSLDPGAPLDNCTPAQQTAMVMLNAVHPSKPSDIIVAGP